MKKELGIKEAVEILKSNKDIEFRPTNYSKRDAVGITPEKGKSGNPQAIVFRRKNSKFGVYVKPRSNGIIVKYPNGDNSWKTKKIATSKDLEECLNAVISAKNKHELKGLLEKSIKIPGPVKEEKYGKFVNGKLQTPKKD
jgi:hypothetical protein